MPFDPFDLPQDQQEAYHRGFEDGKQAIMVGWKFRPIPGLDDQWGDAVYAVSNQVDKALMEVLGDYIGRAIVETKARQADLEAALKSLEER